MYENEINLLCQDDTAISTTSTATAAAAVTSSALGDPKVLIIPTDHLNANSTNNSPLEHFTRILSTTFHEITIRTRHPLEIFRTVQNIARNIPFSSTAAVSISENEIKKSVKELLAQSLHYPSLPTQSRQTKDRTGPTKYSNSSTEMASILSESRKY